MSDAENENETEDPKGLPCVVEVKTGDEKGLYEIDIFEFLKRDRIWIEKQTGLTTADWYRNKNKALFESTELSTAFSAVAIGRAHDRSVADVFEELLDRGDGYAEIFIGFTAETLEKEREARSGPTKTPAASGGTSKRKPRATGPQTS